MRCFSGWFLPVLTAFVVLVFSAVGDETTAPRAERIQAPRFYSLRWTILPGTTNRMGVEVAGVSAASLARLKPLNWPLSKWQIIFPVYVETSPNLEILTNEPPMLGAYEFLPEGIRFRPQFPLEPGVRYRAVFRPHELPFSDRGETRTISAGFYLPRSPRPPTAVREVFPTATRLPANLLKFYIHFSAPMRGGNVYDHIHLRDEKGLVVEGAFLELGEELWDPGMMRLTVFIDPARIKRGVKPLEEIGPVLQEGGNYTLVIDQKWQDANGNLLTKDFTRAFAVGPPQREPIKPVEWKIHAPKSKTRDPLEIVFPEPMDQALAARLIHVTDRAGKPIEGEVTLGDGERMWTFIPDEPWKKGVGRLVVETTLEDLAGNNVGKPFEVDLFSGIQKKLTSSSVKLPFTVR